MSELQERAVALVDAIRATTSHTTEREKLAVKALELIEKAQQELPVADYLEIKRKLLEVLRSE